MIFLELFSFFENLSLQPQISNIPTTLVCSSIDNPVMLYIFSFTYSIVRFQESKFNARNTNAGNQNKDMSFRLTAPENIWCVCFLNSIDHGVWISCEIFFSKSNHRNSRNYNSKSGRLAFLLSVYHFKIFVLNIN